jgi:hypothetical protein
LTRACSNVATLIVASSARAGSTIAASDGAGSTIAASTIEASIIASNSSWMQNLLDHKKRKYKQKENSNFSKRYFFWGGTCYL